MPFADNVRILGSQDAALPLLLEEYRRAVAEHDRPLISFATGSTFTAMMRALASEIDPNAFVATHLDEYVGFAPDRRGGMVHELLNGCAPLGAMLDAGAFLPVPHEEDAAVIAAHERRLQAAGGVRLQFLGIGRNGHIAFNEPGTAFDTGFHATTLAEATRQDARARFVPDEPPRRAVTSGIASILASERIVLCAFGANKAAAVRAMLVGEESTQCPASVLRRHRNLTVLLDRESAGPEVATAEQ